jgi:hypothetical protein
VQLFATCLVYLQQYREAAYAAPRERGAELVRMTQDRICAADPPALAHFNTFWSLIVEQLEYDFF